MKDAGPVPNQEGIDLHWLNVERSLHREWAEGRSERPIAQSYRSRAHLIGGGRGSSSPRVPLCRKRRARGSEGQGKATR